MTDVQAVQAQQQAQQLAQQQAQQQAQAQPTTAQNGGLVGGVFGAVNGLLGNVFGTVGAVTGGVAQVAGALCPAIQSGQQAQYASGGNVFGYGFQDMGYYFPNFLGTAISPWEAMCYTEGGSDGARVLDIMSMTMPRQLPMTEAQALRQAIGPMGFVGNNPTFNGQAPVATANIGGYADIISKLTPEQLTQLKGIEDKIKELAQKEGKSDVEKAEMKKLISELKSLEKEIYGIESDEELPSEIIKNKDGKSYIYSNLQEEELTQIKSNKTNLQAKIDELNKKQESLTKLAQKIQSYTSKGQNPPGVTQAAYNTVNSDMAKLQKEISELVAKNEEYIPSAFKDDKKAEYKTASSGSSTGSDYDLGEKKPEKEPAPGEKPVSEKNPTTTENPSAETGKAVQSLIRPGSSPANQETPPANDKPKPNPEIQAIVDKGGEDYAAVADKISKLDMKDKKTQSYEQARYLLLAAVNSSNLKNKSEFINKLKSSDYDGLPDIFGQLAENEGIDIAKLGPASEILTELVGG